MTDSLAGFDRQPTSFGGTSYDVYVAGSGPAVVVMPEIPGLTPEVLDCGRRLIDAGYTVWIPSLFGAPGKEFSQGYALRTIAKTCIRKEFMAFARGKRAPITDWLRALVDHAHDQCGGPGVGVIGMCFTGNFALALAVDPKVLVPVMSQPSMPLGLTKKHRADLHMAPNDLTEVKRRTTDEDLCVLGMRFTGDPLVPSERFERLRDEFGDAFIGVEINSAKGNPHGFGVRTHSVITTEYRPDPDHPTFEAFALVLEHLQKKLLP